MEEKKTIGAETLTVRTFGKNNPHIIVQVYMPDIKVVDFYRLKPKDKNFKSNDRIVAKFTVKYS